MPATLSAPVFTDAELEAHALATIRDGGTEIGDCTKRIFPEPAFPAPADRTPENIQTWREATAAWNQIVHGIGPDGRCVGEHADCLSSKVTWAFIRLTKAGKLREHCTGFGFSRYSLPR